MAHFAQIDENNVVINVVVVDDSQEHRGQIFLADDLGFGGRWIQTSYNSSIRKKFAGIGDVYDEADDTFKPAKKYESHLWSDEKWAWVPPVDMPSDGNLYLWNEDTLSWDLAEA